MFSSFDLPLGTIGIFLILRRSAVDIVTNLLALFVADDSILTLFCAQISAVSIDGIFLAGEQFRRNLYVMHVGGGHFNTMNDTAVLVYANVSLIPEMPCRTLLYRMCIGVTLLFLVLGRRWSRNNG